MPQKLLVTIIFVFLRLTLLGQHDPAVDSIIREGMMLYRSEMASWHASDLFVRDFAEKRNRAGGYFSYDDEHGLTRTVFFTAEKQPVVFLTYTFDSTLNIATAKTDATERPFSKKEKDLYQLRQQALSTVNADNLFKVYENSQLNLIPVADSTGKRVYVVTGPSKSGVVIFGNDYIIRFDDRNRITSKRALHKNIIPFFYKDGDEVSMHTHTAETGDYITATDICTLMLYERYTTWKQHIVVSPQSVSIWNCGSEELMTMSRNAWDKIMEDRREK